LELEAGSRVTKQGDFVMDAEKKQNTGKGGEGRGTREDCERVRGAGA